MQLEKSTRITLIIVAGLVVLGLGALVVWSGGELDFKDALIGVGVAIGGLAGIGIAGGPSKGAGAAVIFLALALPLSACSGSQIDVARCASAGLRCAESLATECTPADYEPPFLGDGGSVGGEQPSD